MGDITSKSLLDAMDTYGVTKIIAVPRILELFKTSMLRKIKNQNLRRAFTAFVLAAKILPPSVRRKLFTPVHRAMGRHLKTLVVGGAALPQKLDSFFQGLGYEVFVGYGLSEASPVLTISLEQKRTQGDIGKALRNVSLHVNEAGEIVAEGPNVFLGYWPNVHRHGEFNTQDLGNIDARGHVHIVGRTKNLLVYPSGDKIFLEDVEQIADAIPGVEESCAINTGANMGSPEIHVLIISKRTDAVAMKAAIQGKLPYFAKVQKVTIVPNGQLPRTHTLKLNRREIIEKLPELEGSGS
jgi:long-subunit acyl-CoA synthetase (AMP-forming)